MNIDDHWLDDNELIRISGLSPSTHFGNEMMELWPKRYAQLLSSDTYRGSAMVLKMLCDDMHPGISLPEIEPILEAVDQSVKTSRALPAGTDRLGGASLAVANAWESAHSGITVDQLVAGYESELIYVARMFRTARQHEAAAERLP